MDKEYPIDKCCPPTKLDGGTDDGMMATSNESILRKIMEQNQGLMEQNRDLMEQLRIEREEKHGLKTTIAEIREQFEKRETDWEKRETDWESERSESEQKIDQLEKKVDDLKSLFTKAMGITPKSEKGSSLSKPASDLPTGSDGGGDNNGGGDDNPDNQSPDGSSHEQRYLLFIALKRPSRPASMKIGESIQDWLTRLGSDEGLIPSKQQVFGSPLATVKTEKLDYSFTDSERKNLFGYSQGLHSKYETSTVYDFDLLVRKITCRREILTDIHTGLRASKDKSLSLKNSQLSWTSLAKISSLIAEYAFPMERLSTAMGVSYFSSANISRWFMKSADIMIQPYIAMGKRLGQVGYLKTDDTSALVLELRSESLGQMVPDRQMTGDEWDQFLSDRSENLIKKNGVDLVTPVADAFGRISQKVVGDGAKRSINITVVSGKLDNYDHHSMVYFYRTHFGQAGNLMTRLLEYRAAGDDFAVVIQGDMSSQNHVEESVASLLNIFYAGCSSHARRPFFRYRLNDKQLCFFALRCFASLAKMEDYIKRGALKADRVLRVRGRYGRKVWSLLKSVCQSVIEGKKHPLADNRIWKKGDKLYEACAYLIRHFAALTYYLDHPEVAYDNNSSEFALRGEKLINSAAHFRKSENGRVALDIHRTMIASCHACNLPYESYLNYIGNSDTEDVAAHPERYFPHVIAETLSHHDPPNNQESLDYTARH